jgi:transcriptional regulator with XRE-family HTH domain
VYEKETRVSVDIEVVIGSALRHVRRLRGLNLHDVEARSGGDLKATTVAAYERGERTVSLERFFRLCDLYEIAPERLVAEISRVREGRSSVVIDPERIEHLGSVEGLLVADFVHSVRGLRRTPSEGAITLRAGDLEVLASASGQPPQGLLRKIDDALSRS